MAHFSYKARNASGELVQGVLESADTGAAATRLFSMGVTPVEITVSQAPESAVKAKTPRSFFAPRIGAIDLMLFSRQLHTLLKAGVPIMRALAGLQESAANKTFGAVIQDLRGGLEAGRELSASIARHPRVFSPFYIHMVRIGEMTGRLDEILLRLSEHVEFEMLMRDQLKAAMRYPIFVIASMAVALGVINLFVIPSFARVYKSAKAELPLMTEVLIAISNFTVTWWPLVLLGLFGAGFAFALWSGRQPGRRHWDAIKLKLPIAGKIIVKGTLARVARSFALATRSGVPAVEVLTMVARTVENTDVSVRIDGMRASVERGESLLQAATASGVFTPIILQMIAVGEESGALEELMEEIGNVYQSEVEYELKTLAAQIEPILVVGLGVLVLVLALGVFLPIWDLGKVMGR